MSNIIQKLKSEKANSMVENVIILPLIFIIIFAMLMVTFVLHDKSTLEAAAKRGAIYASHCISNPNYSQILTSSGNEKGTLDTSINTSEDGVEYSFTKLGKNIQPYRYITGSSLKIDNSVESEVMKIVENTRIPWRDINIEDVEYKAKNRVFYQDITVTIKADYPIPKFFGAFGMDTEYDYSVTAKMAANDPDEFIRNADLVVDLIVEVDTATGGHISSVVDKISELSAKLVDWIKI